MHYAYPGQKATTLSSPTSFIPRQNRTSLIASIRRRVRLRTVGIGIVCLVLLYVLLALNSARRSTVWGGSVEETPLVKAPAGQAEVVIVTVLDDNKPSNFNAALVKNREEYAKRHGYTVFTPSVSEYALDEAPRAWAKVAALRHALTIFPQTPYFLFIDDHSLVANPNIKVETDIAQKQRIEETAIKDVPVVPPDSVIRTSNEVQGDKVDLILIQDVEGLSVNSFVLRGGEWAKFFLDAWFDPLYRSYNFQRAERHALEHIVQWHGTILNKLVLVPQHILSSYTTKDRALTTPDGRFEEGRFIVSFVDCEAEGRDCVQEMRYYIRNYHGIII